MLGLNNHSVNHSLSGIISILASTPEGIDYIAYPTPDKVEFLMFEKFIDTMKEQEDGSVTQRFQLAALQKMSVKNQDEQLTNQLNEYLFS